MYAEIICGRPPPECGLNGLEHGDERRGRLWVRFEDEPVAIGRWRRSLAQFAPPIDPLTAGARTVDRSASIRRPSHD